MLIPGLHSAPKERCKTFIKRKRWCVEHPVLMTQELKLRAAEKAILCALFEESSEPDEIGINTCLILQNTLDVTVTALAIQNKAEHPNQVKGFVVPNYCDLNLCSYYFIYFAFHVNKHVQTIYLLLWIYFDVNYIYLQIHHHHHVDMLLL